MVRAIPFANQFCYSKSGYFLFAIYLAFALGKLWRQYFGPQLNILLVNISFITIFLLFFNIPFMIIGYLRVQSQY